MKEVYEVLRQKELAVSRWLCGDRGDACLLGRGPLHLLEGAAATHPKDDLSTDSPGDSEPAQPQRPIYKRADLAAFLAQWQNAAA
jgi:hypothetical protein